MPESDRWSGRREGSARTEQGVNDRGDAVPPDTMSGLNAFAQFRRDGARLRGASAALCLALALSGCQFNAENGAFVPSANPVTIDSVTRNDRLAGLARDQHPKILAAYGGEYSDARLERMVAKIVGTLTAETSGGGQAYRITILNSPNVNAFALPGGYLYITRGLLTLANDSSELAAVLSHEMAHVTADHGLERQQREEEETLATQVVDEVLSDNPTARAALVRGKLRLAQFSRNQELEADVVGIRAMGEAGYDPFAAARFLKSMSAYQEFRDTSGASDASLDFLASHPNAPQRIELAQRHARQFGTPGTGSRARDSFLDGIDGMMFGDRPEEGFVRDLTFLHPGLGVAFSVPEGFVIDNSAEAVTAAGPGDVAVRFDGVSVNSSTELTDYIASGWVSGLDEDTIRSTTINGSEAATARAAAEGWKFDVTVIRAGDEVYRLLTAAPEGSDRLDSVARGVGDSFRLLDRAEKAELKPLRIRVVRARAGDTVGSLAARMVGVDRKLSLFRLLNALGPGASVSAGDRVKIVTDR